MKYMYCMFGFMCNRGVFETNSTGILQSGLVKNYVQLLLVTIQHYDLNKYYQYVYIPGAPGLPARKFISENIESWFSICTLSYFVMAAAS
jgi:hypothetical protein